MVLHLSVRVTLAPGQHSEEGGHVNVTNENTAKAPFDCLDGLIKVFIYVLSEDERTVSDKISDNSWDDVSGSQIKAYLLWIWQSSRYHLRISGLSWLCRI